MIDLKRSSAPLLAATRSLHLRRFQIDATEPSLVVDDELSNQQTGWIGLWVGNGSGGESANFESPPYQSNLNE